MMRCNAVTSYNLVPCNPDFAVAQSALQVTMFSKLDLIALAWFLAAWIGYSLAIELTRHGKSGLNGLMHHYRSRWMERMLARETRMMDAQVISALQNGTAF